MLPESREGVPPVPPRSLGVPGMGPRTTGPLPQIQMPMQLPHQGLPLSRSSHSPAPAPHQLHHQILKLLPGPPSSPPHPRTPQELPRSSGRHLRPLSWTVVLHRGQKQGKLARALCGGLPQAPKALPG